MSLNEIIQQDWGWLGFEVDQVLHLNAFGNVLFVTKDHRYWRICPEDLLCEPVANNHNEYRALLADADFRLDWEMERLVVLARETLGELRDGYSYCLKIWAPLGGEYAADNIAQAPTEQVIGSAGNVAFQIKDLPDGGQVQLKITD